MKSIYVLAVFFICLLACKTKDVNPPIVENQQLVEKKIESLSFDVKESDLDPNIPYAKIDDTPEDMSAGSVIARMIDGLGFRYYWATHSLRTEDLEYLPGNDGRPPKDVLNHLYGLSAMVRNAGINQPNVRPLQIPEVEFEELRALTLKQFKEASDAFRGVSDLENHTIIFKRGEQESSFPVWNLLSGPLTDAIYHVGQIVSFRRSSGNPVHPQMNVFSSTIKLKE
jgi:hypothetical protein